MDTLAKLFGGQARVKIMRLFLLNSDSDFEIEEVLLWIRYHALARLAPEVR